MKVDELACTARADHEEFRFVLATTCALGTVARQCMQCLPTTQPGGLTGPQKQGVWKTEVF